MVLAPTRRSQAATVGLVLAAAVFGLGVLGGSELFGLMFPTSMMVAGLSIVALFLQPPLTLGLRAIRKGLVSDAGVIPWSSCEGLELIIPGDGSGRIVLRKPLIELVHWGRSEVTVDTMRDVADALSEVSGLLVHEGTTLSGFDGDAVIAPRSEHDLDEVRFFVSGGTEKVVTGATSFGEGKPVIASREGLRVGYRQVLWKDIRSIGLSVRSETVVVGKRSGRVLAGVVTVELDSAPWVIVRRTVGLTSTTPHSHSRRLCDQRELEGLVVALRKLRHEAMSMKLGGAEEVPVALAAMRSRAGSTEGSG